MRIGILGGSFDPIHIGHIKLAKIAMNVLELDMVYLVPDGISSYGKTFLFSEQERHMFIQWAIEGNENLEYNSNFLDKKEATHTLDIVKYFKSHFPKDQLYFIGGPDSKVQSKNWYKINEVKKYATLAFGSYNPKNKDEFLIPNMEVRSSIIRENFVNISNIKSLLNYKVYDYICDKRYIKKEV